MKSDSEEREPLMEQPPSYEEAIQELHFELQNDQIDFSSIPTQTVLYYQNTIPSTATFEVRNGKIKTFDPLLDDDAEQVFKFFLTHSNAPKVTIAMHGYHSETRTESYTDSEGTTQTRTKSVDVTDFLIKLDISRYVHEKWNRMATEPRKNYPQLTIRETIDEYCLCTKSIKEIHMKKQIMWDLQELEGALRYCIRNTGYSSNIAIQFEYEEAHVDVYSADQWNKIAHDPCCNFLCCISCMWIFFCPLYYLNRN